MKLRALSVRDFGAVESADVTFEDGLNVLHGPNDLGKSTLAAAIRAALLLQHGSSAARPFIPWGSSRKPTVTLTFEVDGRVWRVHKAFGTSSGGKSVLEWSNDGVGFSVQEEGRGVDGELRKLLGWGLAAPGGRGGSHGFPKSFLATVLLGEQALPYQLLGQSLDGDAEDTGKARLIEALQAMATDPLYQQVLLRAQERVDEAFTAKGKRSTRKGSPFERVGAEIKQRRDASEQLTAAVAESDAVVARLGDLSARRDRALTERADAAVLVQRIDDALAKAKQREVLQSEVDAARAALADIQRNQEEIARLQTTLSQAKQAVPEAEAAAAQRQQEARAAQAACDRAEAALKALDAGDDPEQRAEAEACATAMRAVESEAAELSTLEGTLERWQAAFDALAEAKSAHARTQSQAQAIADERTSSDAAAEEAAAHHRAVLDARRWAKAESLRQRLEALVAREAEAAQAREQAAAKRADAEAIELGDDFPTAEHRADIEAAWNALQLREAALGGGVRVALALEPGVTGHAALDGAAPRDVAGETSLDADREVVVSLPAVGTMTVRPGEPTAHAALEDARARWAEHAATLKTLGVDSIEGLAQAARERVGRIERRDGLLREAELLEAKATGGAAEALADTRRESEAAEREVEGVDPKACAALVDQHGADLDAAVREAEAEAETAARAVAAVVARAGEANTELRLAQQRLEAATQAELDARTEGEDPAAAAEALRTRREALRTRRAEIQARVEAAEQAVRTRLERATQAVSEAGAAAERAVASEATARSALDEARATLTSTEAALGVRREQAQHHDTFAAAERVARAEDALAAHPAPDEDLSSEAVDRARATLTEADEALEDAERAVRQQEGALQQVGGQVVRERAQMAREALEDALRQEAEVALDYDGWRLLLGTLREVENETGAHLGRALDSEMSGRLQALSRGRYQGAALGADLETEGVVTAHGVQALDRFSEGVKEQIATLLRVSVAEHLGTTLLLDDHLAQTDPGRSAWFRELLHESAETIQVIVLTCRPIDYVGSGEPHAHVVDLSLQVTRR